MRAHDVHAHYYPPEYVAVVREVAAEEGRAGEVARAFLQHRIITAVPTFLGAVDERLRLMDAAGIERQLLSFASLNIWHPDAATRSRLVAAFNDGCAALVDLHPDRFGLLASLPLPHVEEAVAEARRARGLPGFAGYSIPTHIDTVPIDAAQWQPVYAAMAERPALVITHPDGFCAPGALADHGMEWAIGAPFDDTIAAVRLLASGLLDQHPALTWVIPHLGGTLPFLLHRLLWRWKLESELLGTEDHASSSLERLLFETANCSPHTLRLALDVLPAGRIVFGTDFPFVDPTDLARPVRLVRDALAPAEADAILFSRLDDLLPPTSPSIATEPS
ncbi:amidohydrolase family protein [Microcella sp.]|uniref:amidohydrolase family protein n=1 Tax=Microcella sp. TaxID=1913979 RepID=UPI003F728431